MHFVRLTSTDPAYNLAFEESLLGQVHKPGDGFFVLWQNKPSIIVGRNQNTVEEINTEEVAARSLPVIRRTTGGGAVYHDLGNLNFSFVEYAPNVTSKVDFARYLEPIIKTLNELGVPAKATGRNDIECEGRKISGSAQRIKSGRVLHHGTLLIDLDFESMLKLLTPDPSKYTSKGVASIRSRVANIREYNPTLSIDALCAALAKNFNYEPYTFPTEFLAAVEALANSRYRTWDWNYGASPAYTQKSKQRFPWGTVELRLQVERGYIESCRIYGDFFSVADIHELEQGFIGLACRQKDIAAFLETKELSQWFSGCQQEEMVAFLSAI